MDRVRLIALRRVLFFLIGLSAVLFASNFEATVDKTVLIPYVGWLGSLLILMFLSVWEPHER